MAYYTLVRKHLGTWGIEFGDYTKSVVIAEEKDMRDYAKNQGEKVTKRDFLILKTETYMQSEIDLELAKLNAK